jgi:hypothetical protein
MAPRWDTRNPMTDFDRPRPCPSVDAACLPAAEKANTARDDRHRHRDSRSRCMMYLPSFGITVFQYPLPRCLWIIHLPTIQRFSALSCDVDQVGMQPLTSSLLCISFYLLTCNVVALHFSTPRQPK